MQNEKPAFVTGYGQSDTRALTLSDGRPNPHESAGKPYQTITGQEIAKMVLNPPSVPKERGQWFIPSTYAEHDARTHEVQRARGAFRWLTLDVDENNLDLSEVDAALSEVIGDAARLIYSSRGAVETNRKWRALVPLKSDVPGAEFADVQNAFFDLLEQASEGVLIPDRALSRPAQPVCLPNRGEFYQHAIHKGAGLLELTPDCAIMVQRAGIAADRARAAQEAQEARERRAAQRKATVQGDDVSPVDHFNAGHTVADLLARYGYSQAGSTNDWRSPFQSSGSYATRDCGEFWISLSGSDHAQEIGQATKSGHRFGDAFDLFCHFEHGGDFKGAVRAYALEAGLDRPRHEVPATGQHSAPQNAWEKPMDDMPPLPPLDAYSAPKANSDPAQKKEDEERAKRAAQVASFRAGVFRACDLDGQPVPERAWHVRDLIPSNTVTLFGGDGGTGKSLCALQLAASTALERAWLGFAVRPGKAVYLSAEDDKAELHRRLADIVQAEGVTLADLEALTLRSLAGEDALLATLAKGGTLEATGLLDAIEELLQRDRPDLLVLDTLADYFPGNENDRAQARQFIGMLRGLAIRHECAVVMLAHPSLSGLNSGSGTSGSTGWNNSVRSRLYLSRVVQDGYEPNPDARLLRTMKANYSRTGAEIALTWQNGVFVADAPVTGLDRVAASAKAERVFLKLLREFTDQGRRVNHAGGPTYAPNLFAQHPQGEGCTKKAFKAAMDCLLTDGKIKIATDGPPSKPRSFLTFPDTSNPEQGEK